MAVKKLNRTTIGQTDASCAVDKANRGRSISALAAAFLALAIVAGSPVPASGQAQFPGPKKNNDRNAPKNLTGQVVDKDGTASWPKLSKAEVAERLAYRIRDYFAGRP